MILGRRAPTPSSNQLPETTAGMLRRKLTKARLLRATVGHTRRSKRASCATTAARRRGHNQTGCKLRSPRGADRERRLRGRGTARERDDEIRELARRRGVAQVARVRRVGEHDELRPVAVAPVRRRGDRQSTRAGQSRAAAGPRTHKCRAPGPTGAWRCVATAGPPLLRSQRSCRAPDPGRTAGHTSRP